MSPLPPTFDRIASHRLALHCIASNQKKDSPPPPAMTLDGPEASTGGAAARGRTAPSTSLSAVRRKEAGRVETKESATVAMLARFLDEGEGARGRARRAQGPSGGGAKRKARPGTADRRGHSKAPRGAVIAAAAGGGGRGPASGVWSDVVSAAAAGGGGPSRPNPFAAAGGRRGLLSDLPVAGRTAPRPSLPADLPGGSRGTDPAPRRSRDAPRPGPARKGKAGAGAAKRSGSGASPSPASCPPLPGPVGVAPARLSIGGASARVRSRPRVGFLRSSDGSTRLLGPHGSGERSATDGDCAGKGTRDPRDGRTGVGRPPSNVGGASASNSAPEFEVYRQVIPGGNDVSLPPLRGFLENANHSGGNHAHRKAGDALGGDRVTEDVHTGTQGAKIAPSKVVKKRRANDGNFVRLNLRNSAGSCRGARSKGRNKSERRGSSGRPPEEADKDDDANVDSQGKARSNWKPRGGPRLVENACAGIDPLDDFLDGTYNRPDSTGAKNKDGPVGGPPPPKRSSDASLASQSKSNSQVVPRCTRHKRPCKLLAVKKTGTGNKGRKFYVCGLPRGEQCDFFEWEDDTVHSIQRALLQSSSTSGFIARQVVSHVERFRSLTLPELREEAERRGLRHVGKKGQVLARLQIYVRDEVAKAVGNEENIKGQVIIAGASNLDKENVSSESAIEAKGDTGSNYTDSDEESEGTSDDGALSSDSSIDELELVCDEAGSGGDPIVPESDVEGDRCNAADDKPETLQQIMRKYFGFEEFREGQEWAIRRVLEHQRSLLVAPTGLGKSLCYALPATVTKGVCLVVSPLISLMQDQLRHLPPSIPAATLSGNISKKQLAMTVDDLMKNRLKILFVSPERLASAAFRRLIRPRYNVEKKKFVRQFPRVSLLCVDEAHCLSQWGHNFRPSYLRIRSLLPLLDPQSVLALTATAGPLVIKDICHTLNIPNTMPARDSNDLIDKGVMVLDCNRDNIDVATMVLDNDDNRRSLLHKLLKKDSRKTFPSNDAGVNLANEIITHSAIMPGCLSEGSVIVYVWRQRDAETVAEQLVGAGIEGGVVCYHGGMGAGQRAKAQSRFMRRKARVIVATVAFGLGIDKADVKGVLHLCLPPSLEHYLQEIGRAGRNGTPARAIALVLDDEARIRSSLAYSDGIAKSQITMLCLILQDLVDKAVQDVLDVNRADDTSTFELPALPSIDIALPLSSTVDAIDCKEETIETMLSLLEEDKQSMNALLSVEGNFTDHVIVTLKRRSLEKLCEQEAICRAIDKCCNRLDEREDSGSTSEHNPLEERLKTEGGTAQQRGFLAYSLGTYQFSVLRCARFLGPKAEPRHVFAALRRLQTSGELELALDRTIKGKALHLRLNPAGISCFKSPSAPAKVSINPDAEQKKLDDSFETVAGYLFSHCSQQEVASASKVAKMHEIMHLIASADNGDKKDTDSKLKPSKSARLVLFQSLVQEYFKSDGSAAPDSPKVSKDRAAIVPGIAKKLSTLDSPEFAHFSSDVASLLRDPSLNAPRPHDTSVTLSNSNCIDYASRSLARILHGIDSPRAPLSSWNRHPIWGKWRHYSFTSVLNCAQSVLKKRIDIS